jgi:regulator of protease activity HflC (stomatin/prohibitin superfamily)
MPPPDENTVVDPTGAAWVVWLVIVAPGLLLATVACMRMVTPGELVLVVRQGQVVRSRGKGLVARWPGLERFERVPAGSVTVPLVIRSRTRDGVDVVALADLALDVRTVEPGSPFVSPTEVVLLAESTVGEAVAQVEVRSLVEDLDELEEQWPERVTRLLPAGTVATSLEFSEVEAQLTPRVADVVVEEHDPRASHGPGDGGQS